MTGRIIGYRNYDFKSKENDTRIQGTTLFVVFEKEGYAGEMYLNKKISVSKQRADAVGLQVYVGAQIEIEFDENGRISEIYNE